MIYYIYIFILMAHPTANPDIFSHGANPGGSWFALFASHWPIRDTGTSRPCLSVTGGCIWMPSCFKCPFHDMSFGLFFGASNQKWHVFSRIFSQRSLKLLRWILQNGGFFRKWILRLQTSGVLLESFPPTLAGQPLSDSNVGIYSSNFRGCRHPGRWTAGTYKSPI